MLMVMKVLDYVTYNKLDDAKEFRGHWNAKVASSADTPVDADGKIDLGNNNKKKAEDIVKLTLSDIKRMQAAI